MGWVGYAAHGNTRNVCRVLVGKPEEKRHSEDVKHRWEDNIKMDLWKLGLRDVVCINVA
jgi:hypothetical protein